jgi:hypothetical protein
MDLAGLPLEVARRVPMTTWFRFKRAVEPTGAVMLVVENEPVAHGCASLGVRMERVEFHTNANLLRGLDMRAELVRDVEMKKRVRRETTVKARAEWARDAMADGRWPLAGK